MSEAFSANLARYKALRLSAGNVSAQKLSVLLLNENHYRLQIETQGLAEGVLSGARERLSPQRKQNGG